MLTTITVMILCNNQNWEVSPRCQEPPAYFERTLDGWDGALTNGIPFKQTIYTPTVQRMQFENVDYWIINGQIFYATSD